MGPAKLYALAYLCSGVLLFGLGMVCFFASKRGAKTFLRVLVQENPSAEDEYRMFRALLCFLVAGFLFLVFVLWGIARFLDIDRWMRLLGA